MEKVLCIVITLLILITLCIGIVIMIQKNDDNTTSLSSQDVYSQNVVNSDLLEEIDLDKITIQVDKNSISNTGVTIIITDNNEENLPWGEDYKIQKKENEDWVELKPKNELITSAVSHWKDENNQYKQQINWDYYYGKLEDGQYRIVKMKFNPKNNNYIELYSEDFEIKE